MRKTTFLFFALLLMSIGVWAQTSVTSISADKVYTLECTSGAAHSSARFINDDNVVISGQSSVGSFFYFESTGEDNKYYIRSMVSGKYINYNTSSSKICVEQLVSTKWVTSVVGNTMCFKVDGTTKYLNNNGTESDGTSENLKANDFGASGPNATNACSCWTVREYTFEDANTAMCNTVLGSYTSGSLIGEYTTESISTFQGAIHGLQIAESVNSINHLLLIYRHVGKLERIMPDPAKFYQLATWKTENTGKVAFASNEGKCYWGENETPAGVWVFEQRDGKYYLRNLATGTFVDNYNGNDGSAISLIEDNTKPVTLEFSGVGRKVGICLGSNGQRLNRDQNGSFPKNVCHWNETLRNSNSEWLINEVDPSDIRHTLTIGETGWATLVLGFNATIPTVDGVKVYVVTETSTESATLQMVSGVLPANVAVLVSGIANSTVDFVCTSDAASGITSKLRGTLYNKNITPGTSETCYVLAKPDGAEIPGFYKAELNQSEGTAFLNNANRAYLSIGVSGGAPARYLSFDFGTETGLDVIKGIESASTESVIYDLSGRRVRNAQKGMYIVNGNKVVK